MLPKDYDSIIEKYRGVVPLAYVKAVIRYESSFNPNNRTGSYIGLMQLGPSVRQDYDITEADCLVPETNIRIGCAKLNAIVRAYNRSSNMTMDWNSADYAALVYLGYNAGSSKAAGVQYVTDILGMNGVKATPENVYQAAINGSAPKVTEHLKNRGKIDYSKKVARGYQIEAGQAQANPFEALADALQLSIGLSTGLSDDTQILIIGAAVCAYAIWGV